MTVESSAPEDPQPTTPPKKTPIFQWEPLTLSHVFQISAAIVGTIALLRLSAVAEGDPQLAAAILQATGYVSPVIQMALAFIPTFVILAAAYALNYRRMSKRAGRDDYVSRYAWLIVAWAFVLLAFVASWVLLVLGVIVVAAVLIPAYLLDRRRAAHGETVSVDQFGRRVRRQLVVIVVIVLSMTLLGDIADSKPWIPEEKVTATDQTVRGYVLSVDMTWTTVLVDNPRYLVYLHTKDVLSRQVCDAVWDKTLFQLLPAPETALAPPGCETEPLAVAP